MRRIFAVMFMLFFMCGVSAQCLAQDADAQFNNALSEDGVPIAYSVYGEGSPTLVFIHGWCCDNRYWHNQVPYFAKKYRVVTIDLAGHGNSGVNREVFTIDAFGKDVVAVLQAVDAKDAVLIGHSMGGSVILKGAALAPDRVVGVIGVDTLEDIGRRYTQEEKDAVYKPLEEDFRANVQAFARSMFPEGSDPALIEKIAVDMSSTNRDVALNSMRNYFKIYDGDLIKDVKVPVKSVNADLWPVNVEGNKAIAPSYEIVFLKGRGHFLMLESPDEFNKLLEDMIGRIKEEGV